MGLFVNNLIESGSLLEGAAFVFKGLCVSILLVLVMLIFRIIREEGYAR